MHSHQVVRLLMFPVIFIFLLSIRVLVNADLNFYWNNFDHLDGPQDILNEKESYPNPLANSPFFPALIRSLSRQKNAPDIAKFFLSEYDYIVIGAGTGGSVVSSRLSEVPCVNVLLLEAGKSPPRLTDLPATWGLFLRSDIAWNFTSVPQKHAGYLLNNKQFLLPCGKVLGGSSTINGMMYVRGSHKNYDDWAAKGAVGWSYKDVLPYFKKIEDNRNPEAIEEGYHGFSGPVQVEIPDYHPVLKGAVLEGASSLGYPIRDYNGASQLGFMDPQYTMRGGQRCSAAKAYLVPSERRSNIQILANARVTKILIENGVARGVLFDLNGETYQVMARREVIVSAGTINTAKLLMLSGIGPRRHLENLQIPVVADLPVGQNFQDHIGTFVPFMLTSSIRSITEKLSDPKNIRRYIDKRSGPFASIGLSAGAFLKNPIKGRLDDVPDYQLYFVEGLDLTESTSSNIIPYIYRQLFGPYKNITTYTCISQLLRPLSRGRVTLRSSNPYDPPDIDPNYFERPQDLMDVVEGMKSCLQIGETEPMMRIGTKPLITIFPEWLIHSNYLDTHLQEIAKSIAMSFFHYVGTAKMGDSRDPTTVVDPELRVKGIKRLRVVDASIMPTVTTGNTNIPTMMIGEKGADMIKGTISCNFRKNGRSDGEK